MKIKCNCSENVLDFKHMKPGDMPNGWECEQGCKKDAEAPKIVESSESSTMQVDANKSEDGVVSEIEAGSLPGEPVKEESAPDVSDQSADSKGDEEPPVIEVPEAANAELSNADMEAAQDPADLNGDGAVDVEDVAIVAAAAKKEKKAKE